MDVLSPKMEMVRAGKFNMGDIDSSGYKFNQPVHMVTIQKPFAIGRYQVTFDEMISLSLG
jgi:formylglycine-generating enzyme required for sulfatase activity